MGGSSTPKAQPAQAQPKIQDKEVQEAAAEAVRRKQRQRGYASTVLVKDMTSSDAAKKLQTLGS